MTCVDSNVDGPAFGDVVLLNDGPLEGRNGYSFVSLTICHVTNSIVNSSFESNESRQQELVCGKFTDAHRSQ
jgi:hypothetical protein